MKQALDKEALRSVFDAILQSQDAEAVAMFEGLKERLSERTVSSPDSFFFGLVYPHEKLLRGFIKQVFVGSNDKLVFLLTKGKFIEHHLEKLFQRFEGSACCVDKASSCLSALMKAMVSGEPCEFDYNGEYTFHLPMKLMRTHAERLAFFGAMTNLYYGRPDEYLQILQDIISQHEEPNKPAPTPARLP